MIPIRSIKHSISDPRYYNYRAALNVTVGQVDQALSLIDQSLRLKPRNSDSLALQSIITVVQGSKQQAMDLARKAIAANPDSATACIALSSAQQAAFDIQAAQQSVKETVARDPDNALAYAILITYINSFHTIS